MSFEYLQDYAEHSEHGLPASTIQFQLPEYLYDAPPTLASGGGAEALHPAQAAMWFANSGFSHQAQYPQYQTDGFPAVQDAYHSLESLQDAWTAPFPAQSPFALPTLNHTPISHYALNASPPPEPPAALTSGLPVYSQSGFDIVSLLARVQTRSNPVVRLGPVDFTTAFVVVDVRRHDDPIVYCSPNFCTLTGYREREVLGRNCRFLQAPPAPGGATPPVGKGEERRHTSNNAVRALAKAVGGRKEAQVSVVNYRKDGSAFVNLVSVVPLFGEHADAGAKEGECVWFVGFQIDLTQQSEGICERVRQGTYYAGALVSLQQQAAATTTATATTKKTTEGAVATTTRERRSTAVPAPRVSATLARLLTNPAFLASCGVQGGAVGVSGIGGGIPPDPSSHVLHSLLLGELPDFVHVLSLKGAFLYVAPAVTRVLGWAPAELVGRALADVCFARDVVSVGRALKEASLPIEGVRIEEKVEGNGSANAPSTTAQSSTNTLTPQEALRTVDLVFRARTKQGAWVWVECRGRLHVEPGKGRKAIVLVGRARGMARVGAEMMSGVGDPDTTGPSAAIPTAFHGLIDPHGLLLSVGAGARPLLGYDPLALRGTRLGALVATDTRLSAAGTPTPVDSMLAAWRRARKADPANAAASGGAREVRCMLRGKDGVLVDAVVSLLAPLPEPTLLPPAVASAHLMYAVRAAGTKPPARVVPAEEVFARLDPKTGGSWQYELQQLRFANARLEEEIEELERAEGERERARARAKEMEMEGVRERERVRTEQREQRRYEYQYQPQPPMGMTMPGRYLYDELAPPPAQQWGYPTPPLAYQLPMKRPWDQRDGV
ncbi:blue light receptor [Mycena alexandri]|uniref:Blue light receptor n=1 Tax=Mycena alexandri TaxID=1745969 RepID=A0AAD6WLV5_9AGAR|nr:blue light receptor [Mycena alexandri]